jgi:uncharacterized protein YqhQ
MSEAENSERDDARDDSRRSQGDARAEQGTEPRRRGPAEWFASSALRLGLAVLGIVLLVFAVGRILDVPLLDVLSEALDSQIVLWVVVGLFALLLLGLAARGFSRR